MPSEGDRPWTEAEWEAEMRKADLRTARYQERLETEITRATETNEPVDHDAIAHDMGWDIGEENDAYIEDLSDVDWDEIDKERKAEKQALRAIRAYRLALHTSRRTALLLEPWMGETARLRRRRRKTRSRGKSPFPPPALDEETRALIGEVFIAADIAAAKISGGHTMGYEDHMICGNIVNVRRGLAAVVSGRDALAHLKVANVIDAVRADRLDRSLARLAAAIEEHVAQLRSRVWWQ